MGVILAVVALDDVLGGIGLGLPGVVATGSFIALAYAYASASSGPAWPPSSPGSAQVSDEITASARSLGARAARRARPHPPPAVRGQRAHGRRARRRRRPEGAADRAAPAPDRVRHVARVGLQPGVGVALRAGRAAGAVDHRRGARSRGASSAGGSITVPGPVGRRRCSDDVRPRCSLDGVVEGVRGDRRRRRRRPELDDGELLALVGPSGCGKSTLLRLVAGLLGRRRRRRSASATTIVDDGSHRLDPERRHIGLVFQEHALFPHLTVAQNVAFGLRSLAARRARRPRAPTGSTGRARSARPAATRTSSPEASASGSPWPAPWHRRRG